MSPFLFFRLLFCFVDAPIVTPGQRQWGEKKNARKQRSLIICWVKISNKFIQLSDGRPGADNSTVSCCRRALCWPTVGHDLPITKILNSGRALHWHVSGWIHWQSFNGGPECFTVDELLIDHNNKRIYIYLHTHIHTHTQQLINAGGRNCQNSKTGLEQARTLKPWKSRPHLAAAQKPKREQSIR